jgi:hypothetical protein
MHPQRAAQVFQQALSSNSIDNKAEFDIPRPKPKPKEEPAPDCPRPRGKCSMRSEAGREGFP